VGQSIFSIRTAWYSHPRLSEFPRSPIDSPVSHGVVLMDFLTLSADYCKVLFPGYANVLRIHLLSTTKEHDGMFFWSEMKKRPQIIQGMTLSTLLTVLARNDFQVDARCLGRLTYLVVLGVFNSIYGACERYFNTEDIQAVKIEHAPLFIIGHWRSGTTHLHNLLNLDENFTCPTAYQALFPHHFVFSQVGGVVFNLLAPKKRPMDNVAFSADTPHEDEFAIAAHSAVSPYLQILFPVTGDNGYAKLDAKELPAAAVERWKASFTLFLKKVTLSEGRRIVLKSPPHSCRIGTLLEMFPAAKFVHIVRDPYVVYASTRRLWRDSLAYAHLQIPGPERVDELILSQYEELFTLLERDKGIIPAGSYHEMKFEDLEAKPLETLQVMYDSLGLSGFDRLSERVKVYLRSIEDYRKNEHRLTQADREKVVRRWRATFERYGYPVD
jgi:omega-hydroxy-beta-dihydromenaquinone-9 sulfotransferase